MSDLRKTPDWWEMKYKDEDGDKKCIIRTASDRLKAKEAFEKYEKQK